MRARSRPSDSARDKRVRVALDQEDASRGADRHLRRDLLLVSLLTLAALGLRLWGIAWGLPNSERMCSYHPDEGVNLINGVLDRGVLRPHLDIGFYNYGSLYFLLWQAAGAVNSAYGIIGLPPASAPNAPLTESLASLTLVGRIVSVILGAATVFVVAWKARRIGGMRSALLAGTMQTVAPLAVIHSRFATVDSTATLLTALTLYASLVLLRVKRASVAIVAGTLAGLAAATRYNAVLVVLSAVTAAFLARGLDHRQTASAGLRLAALVGVGCIVGFLIGCPGAVLNWDRFTADLAFEASKSAQGMGLLFQGTGNGFVYHWLSSLRLGLGLPLLLLVTAAAVVALKRREPEYIVLLVFAAAYYGMMGAAKVRFMRYMLPLLPALFVCTAVIIASTGSRLRSLWSKGGLVVACCGALVWAAGIAVAFSVCMTQPDARDLALSHLRAKLHRGDSIAFATTPWYWTPPMLSEFTAPVPGTVRRKMILDSASEYRLRLPGEDREWDPAVLEAPLPEAVVISDLESQDAVRVKHPAAMAFLERLAQRYRVTEFGSRPTLFGISVVGDGYLPVDMLYVCPIVRVYQLQDGRHEHP
ncbi:MAG: hypothetical protein GX446_16890 [Chthonomonadales bacterium]|nr:hypothetical protein [Chthonomonadales bacterium]